MGQFLATLVIAFNFYIGHTPAKAPVANPPQPELTQPQK